MGRSTNEVKEWQFTSDNWYRTIKYHFRRGYPNYIRYYTNRKRWVNDTKNDVVRPMPEHVDLEITSACNLFCTMCYRHRGTYPLGFMSFETFKTAIDELTKKNHTYSIRLSWRGEPTIHQEIVRFVKYAKDQGIKEVSTLTNALFLNEEMAEGLIKAGLNWITISCDGIGKKYESIRIGSKWESVYENVKNIVKIRKRLHSITPAITVQTIWPAIQNNPEEFIKAWEPYADKIMINPLKKYGKIPEQDWSFVCPKLWQRVSITWDGKITQCICDYDENNIIGTIPQMTIEEAWKKGMQQLREDHKNFQRMKYKKTCAICFEGAKKEVQEINLGTKKISHEIETGA